MEPAKTLILLDHQDGTGSLANNPFGNAPHQEPFQTGAAVAPHDNQVNLIFDGLVDDAGIRGDSLGGNSLQRHAGAVGGGEQLMDQGLGLNDVAFFRCRHDGDQLAPGLFGHGQGKVPGYLAVGRAVGSDQDPLKTNGAASGHHQDVHRAVADGKAAKLNLNAEEDEFADQRRKQEYAAAKELYENNFRQQARFAKDDRPDEYESMKRMVDQADKMASRTPPDYAGARQNLDKAV